MLTAKIHLLVICKPDLGAASHDHPG